jgi:coproporphyrinogen III oxidase-like Fe-S oxidoreductase
LKWCRESLPGAARGSPDESLLPAVLARGHRLVSNWVLSGFECKHNPGYGRKRSYLGLGAGAHSYRGARRWWNLRPPAEYLDAVERGLHPVGGEERLTPRDERLEEIFLKLRILEGVPVTSVAGDVASGLLEQGLLRRRNGHLVPTERGMLLLNELVLALVSE